MKNSWIVLFLVLATSGCIYTEFEDPFFVRGGDGGADAAADASTDDATLPVEMGTEDSGPDDAQMGTDAAEMGVEDADVDSGEDAGSCDPAIDPFPETFGTICSAQSVPPMSPCDPVRQTGCPVGEACRFSLVFGNGVPVGRTTMCEEHDCETETAVEGEACFENCAPGYQCVQNICVRICTLEDAGGCAPNQKCRPATSNDLQYGLCDEDCR